MIDDLKIIAQRDKHDAFGVAAKQAQQLEFTNFDLSKLSTSRPLNVVLSGMGGSALAALVVQRWQKAWLPVPFEVVRDYHIPAYVGEETLFIASSYSGNTEETVCALKEAITKGAKVVVVSAGGQLAEIAQQNGLLHIAIPSGIQPRMAINYGVKIIAGIFDHVELTVGASDQVSGLSDWLISEAEKLEPAIGTSENYAKQIAQNIVGKSGVVYSSPLLAPAAYKWKISFNESSKNLAWSNEFSEFDHNEIMGWTGQPVEKLFSVIELISDDDDYQIQKRFEVTNRLLSGQMPAPTIVRAKGDSHLAQLLWTIQLGDFVSLYLAMLNNVDPTPVDTIEKLKKEL